MTARPVLTSRHGEERGEQEGKRQLKCQGAFRRRGCRTRDTSAQVADGRGLKGQVVKAAVPVSLAAAQNGKVRRLSPLPGFPTPARPSHKPAAPISSFSFKKI